jgi:hypothetical protein
VILWSAFSAWRTWVVVNTRVDALRVLAPFVGWTIVVAAASNHVTSVSWIATVTAQASTLSVITKGVTLSIVSARVILDTRVDAMGIDARLARITL